MTYAASANFAAFGCLFNQCAFSAAYAVTLPLFQIKKIKPLDPPQQK